MITIKIDDAELQKRLEEIVRRAIDRRPLMRKIAETMRDAVEENFAQEGRPKWKPSKRALRQGGKTLQDTSNLASRISTYSDNDNAVVGTNVPYAAIHQFGGKIPARTVKPKKAKALKIPTDKGFIFRKKATLPAVEIPARPFLKLTDEDMEEIKKVVARHLDFP